jgi:hypothetical protein
VHEREGEREQRRAAAGARLTPYELAFGEPVFEADVFPAIVAEAEAQHGEPADRERFAFLTAASDALREVVPPDVPAEALEEYRALFFHAFNFWRYGKRVYLLEPALARYLVEAAPALGGWTFAVPYPSVYVQLPANLFWASISAESTPEPVDGFFATVSDAIDPLGMPYQRLEVLMVLGIRREREGFSIVHFDTALGAGIATEWMESAGREKGRDFENVLPGGEIEGLYSILTTTEALKLLARALWYIAEHPLDVVSAEPAEQAGGDESAAPALSSALPYFRVRLGAGGAE